MVHANQISHFGLVEIEGDVLWEIIKYAAVNAIAVKYVRLSIYVSSECSQGFCER